MPVQQLRFVTTSDTLSAATPKQILPAKFNRQRLIVQNTGTGSLQFGFGSSAAASAGISLDPASGALGQGGSYDFGEVVSTDSIWAVSTAGTTISIVEALGNN